MLLAKWHPWNPGYALPSNVLDEAPDQNGAVVTTQAARGTIAAFKPFPSRHPWSTGYAIPGYINAERPGGPVTVTPQAPRGTIAVKQPGVFMQRATQARGLGSFDGGTHGSLTSFGEGSLGATETTSDVFGTKKDPILQYGAEAAKIIVTEVRKQPVAKRKEVMKEILDAIDTALWIRVEKTAEKYANLTPQKALEKALQVELANSMVDDLIKLGRQKNPQTSLDGWFTDLRKGLGSATKSVGSAAGSALGKLGGVACKLTNSGVLGAVAGPAGMASGGPAGAQAASAGANIAGALCAPSPGAAPVQQQQQSGMPSWVVPAAIGGGVLILVLALRK